MKKIIPILLILFISCVVKSQTSAWSTIGNTSTTFTNVMGNKNNYSLRFITNNIFRTIIDSLGNMGINTSLPSAKLHIKGNGSTNTTTSFKIDDNANMPILTLLDEGLTTLNGHLGVNETADPSYDILTNGSIRTETGNIFLDNTGSGVYFNSSGFSRIISDGSYNFLGSFGSYYFNNSSNNSDVSIVYSGVAASVGIGTVSPTQKLDVRGSVRIVDGTQGAGKVLTCDNNGVATWSTSPTGTTYTVSTPLTLTSGTIIGIPVSNTSTSGYLASTDWNLFNGKQPQLNVTVFVKASGTTISYANSTYLTTSSAASTYAPITSPTFSNTVTLGQDATSGLQAVTYQQFQLGLLGRNDKEAAKYATTAALPTVIYANGSSGVGATLTGASVGAISFDSNTPLVGDRVLVKNQVSTFQNGTYTVTAVGSGIVAFVLTRSTDFNQSSEILTGSTVFVTSGTTLSSTTWVVNSADNPVMGTDPITFVQTAGQGSFIAGTGINITGTTISTSGVPNSALSTAGTFTVNGTAMALGTSSTVTSAAGTLTGTGLNSTVVTSSLTTVGTLTAGVWNATSIGTSYLPANQTQLTSAANLTTIGTVTTGIWNSNSAPPVGTVATASLITINTDNYNMYTVTSLSTATTFTAPTGTPKTGQGLIIRIKDNGTARSLTFTTGANGFRFSSDQPAPSTTTLGKTIYLYFLWNEASPGTWDCTGWRDNY